jgi:hypothetical protein
MSVAERVCQQQLFDGSQSKVITWCFMFTLPLHWYWFIAHKIVGGAYLSRWRFGGHFSGLLSPSMVALLWLASAFGAALLQRWKVHRRPVTGVEIDQMAAGPELHRAHDLSLGVFY